MSPDEAQLRAIANPFSDSILSRFRLWLMNFAIDRKKIDFEANCLGSFDWRYYRNEKIYIEPEDQYPGGCPVQLYR